MLAQRTELDERFGAIAQLKRGKTKYGAMMGQNVQGPHTIAHSTIAAIETMAGLDPMARFDTYKKLKIILSVAEVKAMVKKDQTDKDEPWLTARYDAYVLAYKAYLDSCEYWYKQVGKSKPGSDELYDAMNELDLAVTDIRDMHPASTYGGDLELGASKAMMDGKGERKESAVIKALTSTKPGNFAGLQDQIMQDADVGNLSSVDDVYDLRDAYARLAASVMRWK